MENLLLRSLHEGAMSLKPANKEVLKYELDNLKADRVTQLLIKNLENRHSNGKIAFCCFFKRKAAIQDNFIQLINSNFNL
jgi:hypothetical protein